MKNILVIEDEPILLRTIEFILEKQNYNVIAAKNGKEAFEAIDNADYDLVLTDIMLPFANGLEILERIRNKSNTPVIIVSALQTEESITDGFDLGADDYLKKPFLPGELLSRVNRLLAKN